MFLEQQIFILKWFLKISDSDSDSVDWSNDAENTALITEINYSHRQQLFLIIIISHMYCFYCISDEINSALVSIIDYFKNIIQSQMFEH